MLVITSYLLSDSLLWDITKWLSGVELKAKWPSVLRHCNQNQKFPG